MHCLKHAAYQLHKLWQFLVVTAFNCPRAAHRGGITTMCSLPRLRPAPGELPCYASASTDHTIKLWAPQRANPSEPVRPMRTLRGHTEAVSCVQALHAPGHDTLLASGGQDRTVRLWSTGATRMGSGRGSGGASSVPSSGGPLLATLHGHERGVLCLREIPRICNGICVCPSAWAWCSCGASGHCTAQMLASGGLDASVRAVRGCGCSNL
eukprot:361525-Chlamydomonas_euryale.AAC.9